MKITSSREANEKQNGASNFQHREQNATSSPEESTTGSSSSTSSNGVAIIGASYAGLTLANLLHNHGIPYRLYDIKSPPFTFVTGGTPFCVPSFPRVRNLLKLEKVGNHKSSAFMEESTPENYPTRQDVTNLLQERVKKNISYDQNVIKIERKHGNGLYVHHETYSANIQINKKDRNQSIKVSGPYQYVIGADGVLSKCRNVALSDIFLIGDARWVNDRWYDLGFQRIKQGADIAMQDAIELGELIVKAKSRDGPILMPPNVKKRMKFCAKSIRIQRLSRNALCAALLILAMILHNLGHYSFFNSSICNHTIECDSSL
jgi:2-polyprenyl-6-methoxyphenol hydroxylase and related FAD-dependent oxidoreductases